MLTSIGSSDARFKAFKFNTGFNILVADIATNSADTDSRNGVGKSSLVEIMHFLLGLSRTTGSVLANDALSEHSFNLQLDWPVGQSLYVIRTLERRSKVEVSGEVENGLVTVGSKMSELTVPEWIEVLGRTLFGLPEDHSGVGARQLLSYYLRRISQHGFNDPVQTNPRQSVAEATTNVAYLLGLDWRLAAQYQDIASREAIRRKLVEAIKDPAFNFVVGSVSELRGLIAACANRVNTLHRQVEQFTVVPEYEELQAEADRIDGAIRASRAADAADRRNVEDLAAAIREEQEPDVSYLSRVYQDLGVQLPDQLLKRYEDVKAFHDAVVANRRTYLEEELAGARTRIESRLQERSLLGARHAELLQALNEGGALASYTVLQDQLSVARGELETLRGRLETAKALEETQADIRAARSSLQRDLGRDLSDRESAINEINALFQRFASALYGTDREAFIDISALETSLRIAPHIGGEDSEGINKMVTFCFDFTVAVTAHRGGRGPDFLVHDSHLFDGVDARQIAKALRIAREVCTEEGLQYIISMNSDDLEKVERSSESLAEFVLSPRLTDSYVDGGLFGFRFN